MTRKDYTKAAAILAGEYALTSPVADHETLTNATRAASRETVENIAASLADMFAQDNPRFNRAAFYVAALGRKTVRS